MSALSNKEKVKGEELKSKPTMMMKKVFGQEGYLKTVVNQNNCGLSNLSEIDEGSYPRIDLVIEADGIIVDTLALSKLIKLNGLVLYEKREYRITQFELRHKTLANDRNTITVQTSHDTEDMELEEWNVTEITIGDDIVIPCEEFHRFQIHGQDYQTLAVNGNTVYVMKKEASTFLNFCSSYFRVTLVTNDNYVRGTVLRRLKDQVLEELESESDNDLWHCALVSDEGSLKDLKLLLSHAVIIKSEALKWDDYYPNILKLEGTESEELIRSIAPKLIDLLRAQMSFKFDVRFVLNQVSTSNCNENYSYITEHIHKTKKQQIELAKIFLIKLSNHLINN